MINNRTDITRRTSTNRRATCIWWKLKSVCIGEKESIYKTGSKRFCKGMGKECRRRSSSRPRWHVGWTRVSCRTVHRRTVPSRPDIDKIFSRGHQRDQRHHQFAPYGGGGYNHGGGGGRYNDNRAPIQHNPNSNYVQWDGERKKSDQQQSGWR